MGKDYINQTLSVYHFRRPSFMRGMARLLDIAGSIRAYKVGEPGQADYQAIKSDWEMVGKDLNYAIQQYAGDIDATKELSR